MAYLIPSDKGTHYFLASVLTMLVLWLPVDWPWAAAACAAAAIGREVYGWWRRGWVMTRDDALESARDIGMTLAGGAVVLGGALVKLSCIGASCAFVLRS